MWYSCLKTEVDESCEEAFFFQLQEKLIHDNGSICVRRDVT